MTQHSGKVTWFDEKRGFGFLACRHEANVFIDLDTIDIESCPLLKRGDQVIFDMIESDVGPRACSVVRGEDYRVAVRLAYMLADDLLAEELRRWTATGESGPQTILLIEEDDILRAERSEFFWAAGYLVAGCPDAQLAAEVYHSGLVIDMVMASLYPPEGLGERIRDLGFLNPQMPVLFSAPAFPLDLWEQVQQRRWHFVEGASTLPALLGAVRGILRIGYRIAA